MTSGQRSRPRSSGALHEDISRAPEVVGSSDRSFGFVFAAAFAVVALWSVPAGGDVGWWAVVPAAAFAAAALVRPKLLAPLNRLWLRFGLLLGRVTTPLVLGLIFFAVVTPTALLMRWRGRDPMRLRRAEAGWVEREPGANTGNQMRRQF